MMTKTLSPLTLALMTVWCGQALAQSVTPPTDPQTVPKANATVNWNLEMTNGQDDTVEGDLNLTNPAADAGLFAWGEKGETATLTVNGSTTIDASSDKVLVDDAGTFLPNSGIALQTRNINTTFKGDVTLSSTLDHAEGGNNGNNAVLISGDGAEPTTTFEKDLTINMTTNNDYLSVKGASASKHDAALKVADAVVKLHNTDIVANGDFSNILTIIAGVSGWSSGGIEGEGDHFNVEANIKGAGVAKGIYLLKTTPYVTLKHDHVSIKANGKRQDPKATSYNSWNQVIDMYRDTAVTIDSKTVELGGEADIMIGLQMYNNAKANITGSESTNIKLEGGSTYGIYTNGGYQSNFGVDMGIDFKGDNLTIESLGTKRATGVMLFGKTAMTLDNKTVHLKSGLAGNSAKGEGAYVGKESTFTTTANNELFSIEATEQEEGGKGIYVADKSVVDLNSQKVDITLNRHSDKQSAAVTVDGSTFKTSANTDLTVKSTSTDKQNRGVHVKGTGATVTLGGAKNTIVTVTDKGAEADDTSAAVTVEGTGATITIGADNAQTYIGAQTNDSTDFDANRTNQAGNAFFIKDGQTVNVKGTADVIGNAIINASTLNIKDANTNNRWAGEKITVTGAGGKLDWASQTDTAQGVALEGNVYAQDGAEAKLSVTRTQMDYHSVDGEMRDRLIDGATTNGNVELTLNNATWRAEGISTISTIKGTNARLDMTSPDVNNVFIQNVDSPLTIAMDLNPAKRDKTGVLYTHTLGADGKLIFDFADLETVDLTKTYENPLRFATTTKAIGKDKIEVLRFPEKSADGLYTFHWGEDDRANPADDNSIYMGLADQLTEAQVGDLIAPNDQKYWVITATLDPNARLDRFALPKHLWWNMDSYDERQGGIKVDPQHRNLWVRARGEWADEARFTDAQVRSLTYDVGYSRELNNEWKASVFGEYREATATFQTVDAKTHAYRWGAGVIFTRTRDRDYLDIVGRFTRDNLKMASIGSNARPHMNSWMASVEYGRHYQYENGRYLVPQIQGTILRMKTKNYHWEGGSVTSDHVDAYGLRLGLKAGIDKPKYGVWARADLLPSFDGKQAVYVNVQGATLTQTTSNYGLGFDLGVGAHRFLNQNWTLTGSAFYNRTPGVKRAFRANVNLTRTF